MEFGGTRISSGTVILVVAVILFLGIVFFTVSRFGALSDARERLAEEEQALQLAEIQLERLQEIGRQAPEFAKYLTSLEHLMPGQPEEDALIACLEKMAVDNDVRFSRINFNARQETDDGFVEIPLNLTFQGDYRSFLSMMSRIQQPQEKSRAFRVENLQLNQDRLELNVKAFYRDQPEPDESDETSDPAPGDEQKM